MRFPLPFMPYQLALQPRTLKRFRLKLRGLMIAVAILALLLWGGKMWRVRSGYLQLAADCATGERLLRKEQKMWEEQAAKLKPGHVLFEHSSEQAAQAAASIPRVARLRRHYEEAARHPWRHSAAVQILYKSLGPE